MERKWEHLPTDCLVLIFQKLEVQDLVPSVPLVCKTWHKATLSPLCWQVLNMGNSVFVLNRYQFFLGCIPMTLRKLFRLLIQKSDGSAIIAIFPDYIYLPFKDVLYFLKRCPMLEILALPAVRYEDEGRIIQHAHLWENLQHLYLRYKPSSFGTFVEEISHHCKNLVGLQVCGYIVDSEAAAITKLLPKLKYLCLSGSVILKDTLLQILKGCRELEELLLEGCYGFRIDQEVLDSAAHIKIFKYDPPLPKDEHLVDLYLDVYGSPLPKDAWRWYSGKQINCGGRGEVQFLTHQSFLCERRRRRELQREYWTIQRMNGY